MRQTQPATAVFKAILTVLVALFVAVRVVAQPVILSAPEPGLMALCAGGKIVYVSIETGQPVGTGEHDAPAADPCPFFGVTAFDHGAKVSAPKPLALVAARIDAPEELQAHVKGFTGQNTARAPPKVA